MVKELVLDLNDFVGTHSWEDNPGLWTREKGLAASKQFKLTTMTDPGVTLTMKVVNGVRMDESFLKAFLGPLARKVGPEVLMKRVKVQGGFQGGKVGYRNMLSMAEQVQAYLLEEAERIVKRDAKKAKDDNPEWSDSIQFFVPDIGTRVKLTKNWTFRLYHESRNYDFFKKMGWRFTHRNWRVELFRELLEGQDYDDKPMGHKGVTIHAGSVLKVNRIYIRQGVGAYSSLTFNLQKGAVVDGNADVFMKGGVRFWAKLSDVNKMEVVVDKASLAEN